MKNIPSKGWATLIIGFLTGSGIIFQHPDEVNTILGAIVTIITAIVALHHDIEMSKIATVKETTQSTTTTIPTTSETMPLVPVTTVQTVTTPANTPL